MSPLKIRAAAMLCAALATPVSAAAVYKAIGADGDLQYSDVPPEKARNVERIRIADSTSSVDGPATPPSGAAREAPMSEADAALSRANARLDLAEHALAETRHAVARDAGFMHMVSTRMSRADQDRLAYYKRDVLLARQALLAVVKERRAAAVTQTFTASNEPVALSPTARP
jgi:Domain of unknown function (DUF4124)